MDEPIDIDQLEGQKVKQYYEYVKEIFPDVDEEYLKSKCIQYAFDQTGLNHFIEDVMLCDEYPKEQPVAVDLPYDVHDGWKEFTVENFLKRFPDPLDYFSNGHKGTSYVTHMTPFLQRKFRFISAIKIKQILRKHNYNFYLSYKAIEAMRKTRKTARTEYEIVEAVGRPPSEYYDEVAFINNEVEILEYIQGKVQAREAAVAEAKKNGSAVICGCCFEDLLPEEVMECPKGHQFCKECIKRSSEVVLGNGKIDFPCLQECDSFFMVEQLKGVMNNNSYEVLLKKLQQREIAQANISGLESCPVCDYSAILEEESRVFDCPNCKASSCRYCRKNNHIPYGCEEAEDIIISNRTYVEEKMTEALTRDCYKCGSKFVREDGCNKMKCYCGATMCYICRQPIVDYSHFRENSNDNPVPGRCPLWTSDIRLKKQETEKVIREIKRENPDIDPDVYKKLKK